MQKIEHILEKFIFNGRWLLAPFFLGLIIGIALLFIKFLQELEHLTTHVFNISESEVIVGVLALIDITLVGSLLLMIIFTGYEIFVSKIDHADRPDWMGKVDFSGLKLKVIGAIVAISAIQLLRTFMTVGDEMIAVNTEMYINPFLWKVVIHMTFVLSGVFFALMDRIAAGTGKGRDGDA